MLKSLKFVFLALVMAGSLFLGPVSTVHALTYPAEINKSFTPISITSGGTSILRVTIYNPNTNPLTNAAWVDDLISVQPGLSIANPPNVSTNCAGGTVTDGGGGTVDSGDTSIRLTGATVAAQVGSTPGSCYVQVSVTSTTPGNLINTIPTNTLTATTLDGGTPVAITNTTPASATLNVIAVQPPSLSKGFAPNTIYVGQLSTLTITVHNNDQNSSLTSTTLRDALPTGVTVANPLTTSLTGCGAGTLTNTLGGTPLAAGDTSIALNNATIAKNASCVITVAVTSVQENAYTNTIPAGPASPDAVHTQQGVTNASPASANLNVQAFNLSKTFSPTTIPVGGTTQLTITIQNPAASFTYTGASITDNLPTGLVIANPVTTSLTGCGSASLFDGGGGSLDAGDTSIQMTGGDIAANSTCTITVNVTATMNVTAGTYTNNIPADTLVTDQGNSNHAPATSNLSVVGLSLAKAFSPATFAAGSTSTLTITVSNPSPNPFTGANLADTLPTAPNSNLRFTGTPTTTCTTGSDGAAVALSGAPTRTVTLTSGTIPGGSIATPGTCTITVQVTTDANAPAAGPYTNTIPANTITTTEGGTNPVPATANVTVTTVSVSKVFATSPIVPGGTSLATITITNPATAGALTGINLTDTLPTGLQISGTPTSPQCNGGTVTNTATSITLTGGALAAGPSTCTLQFTVTAPAGTSSGTYTNTMGPGTVTTNQGPTNSNTSNTNIVVNSVTISKAFSPTSFQSGGTTTLTITLTNPSSTAYTGAALSDTLPTQLSIAGSPASVNNCGGTLTATGGAQTITLVGGTIPANGNCTLVIPVTSSTAGGPYTNSIPPNTLTTTEGAHNTNTATSNVSVYPVGQGVTLTKTFNPTTINRGENSRLRLTVTAPADTSLTNFSITDDLPGDLTVSNSTAPTITGCGVTYPSANFNPQIGDTAITLTGGTINAGATCTITVYVTSNTGTSSGVVNTNTINPGDVTNTENRSISSPVSTALTVRTVSTLTTAKSFYPPIVNPGGLSTLTITLTNTNASALVNVSLTDNLPGSAANGIVVAPTPNANTTCAGGTVTATTGSQVISLANATIPAQVGGVPGICTITVDVQGTYNSGGLPVTRTNTIPTTNVVGTIQGTTSTMNALANATSTLQIQNLSIEIVKGFDPQLVYGGEVSTLSIRLRNPNTSAVLTGISYSDTMPVGMIIANPPDFTPSAIGDCGTGATLTGTPGTNVFTFSNGTLAAGAECTMTLSVTMTVNGNLTNTIPASTVSTFNGVTNGTATSASLTNLAGASISKSFSPGVIPAGLSNYSILTITITSTANVALTQLGLVDNLPAGLEVAGGSAPAPSSTCYDASAIPAPTLPTVTANPGDTTIELSNGSMPIGFIQCDVVVAVTGPDPGSYTNVIPAGSITNNEGVSNPSPTQDTLVLTPFSLGNRVWYDTNNNGLVDGTEVGIPGVRVDLYRDNGTTPGIFDAGDTFVGFETTNATGYYRFDDLGSGDYVVVIPADNFRDVGGGDTVPGNPLAGYVSSGTSISSSGTITDSFGPDADITVLDDDDNGTSSFTGTSLNYVSAQAVTIGPGANEPTGETNPTPNPDVGEAPDAQSDRTVDFGFYRLELGNQVFVDLNGDGIFNAGDAPMPNAVVQLYASNGTTEINVGPDGILGTSDDAPGGVLTNASGNYQFTGLPAGDYVVKVTPSAGYSTIDSADTTTPNNNVDNNDNGIGTGTGQVTSNVVTLTPGVTGTSTTVDNNTATTSNPSMDFGFGPLYSLGNRVWYDTDNSGAINGAEVGISGVRVELYQDNGNGVYDAGDTFLSFDTTDVDGYYLFNNLQAGDYVVYIPPSQFASGGPLDGYWSSETTLAANGSISDATNNDADIDVDDSDDNGITTLTGNSINYVSSRAVTLGPGAPEPTGETDPTMNPLPGEAPDAQSNRTLDFGFYRVELGDQVFWDVNGNGTFDGADTAIAGAKVQLFASNGTTEINVGPDGIFGTSDDAAGGVTTGTSGTYLFSGLPAGDYIVRVTPPVGFASTNDNADATDTTTPNTNTDNNDNGVGTASGIVSSNVVSLIPGVAGVSNTVTNSTGTTTNPSVDFGFVPDSSLEFSLGNRVWFDTNNDGLLNGSEVGVGSVDVELYIDNGTTPGVYDAGDTLVTSTQTDSSGYYMFNNLAAGNYVVVIPSTEFDSGGPLAGYWSSGTAISDAGTLTDSISPDADTDATDSDDNGVSTFAGNTLNYVSSRAVTLGPSTTEPTGDTDGGPIGANEAPDNQSNRTVDFGFYQAQLGNQIFVDSDNSGYYNSGDQVLPGATVQLFSGDDSTEILVGPDGILGTADDTTGGVTTGAGGTYLFSGLPQGNYVVRVTPPAGYFSTVDADGDTSTPNSNVNNNDNGIGVGSGQVSSNPVALTPGAVGSNNAVTNNTGVTYNPTMDFGFVPVNGLLKTVFDTDQTFSSGLNVAIGEIVTYQIIFDVPAGVTMDNVVVTDVLDKGLAFVDCVLVDVVGTDQTGTVCPPTVNSVTNSGDSAGNPANPGRQIIFNIGNIPVQGTDSTVTIRYRAVVLDVIENQNSTQLNNSVNVTWTGGSLTSSAPNVRIAEPDLSIDKSAIPSSGVPIGTPIQFTLTIAHTAQSALGAYDVEVTDILPAGLEYIPCTVQFSGLVPTTPTAPAYCPGTGTTDLTFQWDEFPLGATSTITFNARLIGSPVTNTANVLWTSLPLDPTPGGPVQLSTFNAASTERRYDPLNNVDIYGVSASVTINPPGGGGRDDDESARATLPTTLPPTGFAPGVVTDIPEQPADKAYASTDVWMEIPSLGLSTPIVGVPLTDGNWDITWLWKEAGWLNGTAFPGWQGNSVLTGHVTLPDGEAGPFAALAKLKWGDRIIVHAYGTQYVYEVRQNRTISPYNTSVLQHEKDAWLTLLTCDSYNVSTNTYANRIAVRAILVNSTADKPSNKNVR